MKKLKQPKRQVYLLEEAQEEAENIILFAVLHGFRRPNYIKSRIK